MGTIDLNDFINERFKTKEEKGSLERECRKAEEELNNEIAKQGKKNN